MADSSDTQLLKGVLPLLLISTILSSADGQSYGFEIVTRLRTAGMRDLSEGTVYPALSRLEREKYLRSRLIASNQGPARKYYSVTAKGREFADGIAASWQNLTRILDGLRPSSSKESTND
jgi:PadR family transcriptional regulator, regulatory protein PadR